MLSRDLLRNDPDRVRTGLTERGADLSTLDRLLELDGERRAILVELEDKKRLRNDASKRIGDLKRQGLDAAAEIAATADSKARIEELEARLAVVDESLAAAELTLPNLAHASVPVGRDEHGNRVEKVVGTPRVFDFEPKAHWDLGVELGILDFERGAKVTGARFTASFGAGARLERALINFMLDLHTGEHGYTEVLPPFIVNADSLVGTGQLPKFAGDLFHLEGFPYYLVPTAEVPLTNLHRGEMLEADALPVRYTAYTPCFRSEAGSYGKDVRGLIRQHQFNKVELVQLTTAESSYDALEELTRHAETVLERLELPYRRMTLCTGDMGFGSAKTHDLEVWLPGQNAYREISSCSNCEAFQSRRADLRYRDPETGKPKHLHTLNGSGLAVGRTLIAILENYQEADGTVTVPTALRPYLGGLEKIVARG
ncbi:MAG: serine--tRNA ligase [Thermoanaerobaculia bacterium]|nr:serine--tRNA ligase [Thermoanaerobaculia bacterium]